MVERAKNNMLQKKQIEMILKVNGVDISSSDEEIRSVLLSASFKDNDIETAIMILKENTQTQTSKIEGLHKVFRTNQRLSSEEISTLLGIDVNIDELPAVRRRKNADSVWLQNISVIVTAIGTAFIGVVFAMYIYDVGLFHKPSLSI